MAEETKESSFAKASKDKEKIEVPEKFKKLVEDIEKLSVLDLAELVKVLEKKFGVSAQAPVAMAAPSTGSGQAAPAEEEKSVFNVVLIATGDKKIEVIKVVRDATEKGLKEAKDLVDASATGPQIVKENVKKEEAEAMKKKFEAAGAKVELK
jgi:large subunit ribosomal protein L7/L12